MTDLKTKCEHCGGKLEYVIGETRYEQKHGKISIKSKTRNALFCSFCKAVDYDTFTWHEELKKQRVTELKKLVTERKK